MLADGVDLRAVFGPEHGFRGIAQAGASTHPSLSSTAPSKIATTTTTTSPDDPSAPAFFDPRSGLPVFDVYRKSGADLVSVFRRADVDVIAFDMQDVGARFYTYLWTLYDVLVAAAASDPPMRVVVLDRPDPVGGDVVEGPAVVEDGCASFLARKSVALRHGMTLGELARMLNRRDVPTDPDNPSGEPARLAVVPCRGWRRDMTWAETRLPWTPRRRTSRNQTPRSPTSPRVCSKPRTGPRDEAPRTRSNSSARRGRTPRSRTPRVRGTRAIVKRRATARRGIESRARASVRASGGARREIPRGVFHPDVRAARGADRRRGSGGPRRRGPRAFSRGGIAPRRRQANVPERVRVARGRARAGRETPRGSKRRANHARDEPRGGVQIAHQSEAEGGERGRGRRRGRLGLGRRDGGGSRGLLGRRVQRPIEVDEARRAMVAARAFDAAPPTIRRAPFVDLLTGDAEASRGVGRAAGGDGDGGGGGVRGVGGAAQDVRAREGGVSAVLEARGGKRLGRTIRREVARRESARSKK